MYRKKTEIFKINLVYQIGLVILLISQFLPPSLMKLDSYASPTLLLHILLEFALALLPFMVLICLPNGSHARKRLSFHFPGIGTILLTILLSLPLFYATNSLATLWVGFLGIFGAQVPPNSLPEAQNGWELLLAIVYIGITPAICEEITFRGFFLTGYRDAYGKAAAVIVSGLCFGLMHGTFYAAPVHVGLGFLFGLLYILTDSLWPGIILHFFYNSLSLIVPYLLNLSGSETAPPPIEGISLNIAQILSGSIGLFFVAAPIVGLLFAIYAAAKKHKKEKPTPVLVGNSSFLSFLPLIFAALIVFFFYFNTLLSMFIPQELWETALQACL